MMQKFLERMPAASKRRWLLRRKIVEHEQAVERAHHAFEESKLWSMQKLVESQEAQQAYKDFKKKHGLEDDG